MQRDTLFKNEFFNVLDFARMYACHFLNKASMYLFRFLQKS